MLSASNCVAKMTLTFFPERLEPLPDAGRERRLIKE